MQSVRIAGFLASHFPPGEKAAAFGLPSERARAKLHRVSPEWRDTERERERERERGEVVARTHRREFPKGREREREIRLGIIAST